MIDKRLPPSRLLWLDLELTGLDLKRDIILEVAVLVTDFNFNNIAEYHSAFAQDPAIVRSLIEQNSWWAQFPETRDELIKELAEAKPLSEVETDLINLVDQHFKAEPAVLAGNSIHNDRNFIRRDLAKFDSKLHYRMLDVSSLKVLMQGKYAVQLDKPEVHRAREDILASIEELKYYLNYLAHGS